MRVVTVLAAVATLVPAVALLTAQHGSPAHPGLLKATISRLPIYFIENRGVHPEEVTFTVQGTDKTLFFTKTGITYRLKGKDRAWVVKLDFVGANPDVEPRGEDKQPAVFSYFTGPEKEWRTGLATFAKVVYQDLWPGIDLVYRGAFNQLKYAFVVKPGADPGRIRLRYRGADRLRITDEGALGVSTPEGGFEDARPVAWQEIRRKRVHVKMVYALGEGGKFGFDLGDYDRSRPLVLDPAVIVYCGYIGGVGLDQAFGVAADAMGHAYVAGLTDSTQTTFPVKVGPSVVQAGNRDAFVAKVSADGASLVYCGFIGGAGREDGLNIAVDAAGSAYICGLTGSTPATFPVKGGPGLVHRGGLDVFVAKVNPAGTALVYCGYIGGTGTEESWSIAVDGRGSAYVSGWTNSNQSTFPVRVGPALTHGGGGWDAFVAKVNPAGAALDYCGYIGGNASERAFAVAVDATGAAYVCGETQSSPSTFPVRTGPFLSHGGGNDAFVAKVNPAGTGFTYCGYIGGAGNDHARDIAVDGSGNAYVTGETASTQTSFPVTGGPFLTYGGGNDGFVAKVNPAGSALTYCGYIGGSNRDSVQAVAVDRSGNAYVAGQTTSDEKSFPVMIGPDLTHNSGWDGFVAGVTSSGMGLIFCGYIGGVSTDNCLEVALDAAGNVFVAGGAGSNEWSFPVRGGPRLVHRGGPCCDGYVAKVSLTSITASGTPRPGGTIQLTLTATRDAGLGYRFGSSLGTGPISIGNRRLGLSPDPLLAVTVNNYWPSIFSGYRGVVDSNGQARAAIHIPNILALIGLRLHSAFVTLDAGAPLGIKSISSTFSFPITK